MSDDRGPMPDETTSEPSAPTSRPVLTLDVALYEHMLADSDLTEDQKREFLETLWSIIVGFVDLGFGIDPVGLACGQNPETSCGRASESATLEAETNTGKAAQDLRDEEKASARKGRSHE
ncbi:hypothetical protein [Rhodobium gokarnense]|uniref:Uncharacterized protein n=1 Tax=Rhodobium gokarnense TaxID=364296 RepID=A0ABT3HEK8_9HYPH|nr:hypothetical protein [Rhodobium gokarnense]MCW2308829.1 hypothetical protein [Rhodobium gokarnense]